MTHLVSLWAFAVVFSASSMAQLDTRQSGTPSTTYRNRLDVQAPMRTPETMVVPESLGNLRLAPGFLVGLSVLEDPDFNGSFRIDQEGNIELPTVGPVHIAGQTASEARTLVQQLLVSDQILKNPQVGLTILEYTAPEVTILGEVASPGKYPLLAPTKLVNVMALAGGPNAYAGKELEIIRADKQVKPMVVHYSRDSDPKEVEDVIVNPGDMLQMKRAGVVYVLGAVNKPGGYLMQEEGTLTVLQVIPLASGTAPSAKMGTFYLLRKNEDGSVINISIPYKEMTRGKRQDIQLQARDVLYVMSSGVKEFLTNSQALLSSAASATIYATAR